MLELWWLQGGLRVERKEFWEDGWLVAAVVMWGCSASVEIDVVVVVMLRCCSASVEMVVVMLDGVASLEIVVVVVVVVMMLGFVASSEIVVVVVMLDSESSL